MKIFKDNADRVWTIQIHVTAVKRLRAILGLDLYGLIDDEFKGLGKLLGDPVAFVDALFVLCQDQARDQGVTDENFGQAMWGDAIQVATDAFLAELTDFFPDPRVRAGISKVIEKSRIVMQMIQDRAMDQLENLDLESIARKSTGSSGNLRESSESIPARLRSAS